MPLSAGTKLGAYEIVSLLGAGGMGEVYRARDTRLGREVAIKILPDQFAADAERIARFQREAHVLASLNHPNIAHIHGLEDAGTNTALVLELVDGPTLADLIAKGPIPLDEALPIAKQIADALEAAHEHGIIHRDLKPANIKLTAVGTVKVLDFGLAKAADASTVGRDFSRADLSMSPTITSPAMGTLGGVILGTAAYMSPEQAKGKPVDKRTDIWAFGCVLFEMLTGKRAFEGEDVSDTLAAILRGDPDWAAIPSDVPPAIVVLIRGCLEKDRRRRVGDIAAARFVLAELAVRTSVTDVAPVTRRRGSKLVAAIAAGVVIVALLAISAVVYVRVPSVAEPMRRLAIPLPDGAVLTHFALSPDGQRLALVMVTGETEARSQIFVRSIDSTELRALPGTFRARDVFWSVDGRSLGFFADGKLKIVPASGGPPQDLCDGAGFGAGGAWNGDDVILFGSNSGGRSLRRVSAKGGECVEVKLSEGFFGFPRFLPDGRHFLYVIPGPEPSRRGLYIADLDTLKSRRLLADASSGVYSPSSADPLIGHILFVRESVLTAVGFDTRSQQIIGDAFPVASQAAMSFSAPQIAADASKDGLLVYLSNRVVTTRFTWIDGTGTEAEVVGNAGIQQNVELSPDRRALVFSREGTGWLRDLRRNLENSLFTNVRSMAVWSPDGRHVMYGRLETGDLFVKDVATGKEEQVPTETSSPKFPSDWSRDGSALLYTQGNVKTQADIWSLIDPLNKSNRRRSVVVLATPAVEAQAQISPDGRWVAYVSDESGSFAVYLKPFPEGAGKWRISPAEGREPRWSVDGSELYYLSGVGGTHSLHAVAIELKGSEPVIGEIDSLFEFHGRPFVPQSNIFQYDVGLERRRFLVNVLTSNAAPTLNVITNWHQIIANQGNAEQK